MLAHSGHLPRYSLCLHTKNRPLIDAIYHFNDAINYNLNLRLRCRPIQSNVIKENHT